MDLVVSSPTRNMNETAFVSSDHLLLGSKAKGSILHSRARYHAFVSLSVSLDMYANAERLLTGLPTM